MGDYSEADLLGVANSLCDRILAYEDPVIGNRYTRVELGRKIRSESWAWASNQVPPHLRTLGCGQMFLVQLIAPAVTSSLAVAIVNNALNRDGSAIFWGIGVFLATHFVLGLYWSSPTRAAKVGAAGHEKETLGGKIEGLVLQEMIRRGRISR